MPQYKKILVSLPETLLDEIDDYVLSEHINRSEFVRRAMKGFLRERQRNAIRERLKTGYQEMADINLRIAEMCFEADQTLQLSYEEKLSESED